MKEQRKIAILAALLGISTDDILRGKSSEGGGALEAGDDIFTDGAVDYRVTDELEVIKL